MFSLKKVSNKLSIGLKPMTNNISAIFLDRDGVINEKLEGDYVKKWSEFKFLPGAIDAIKLINEKHIPVYMISNQSGIGRGLMTKADLEMVHTKLVEVLAENNAHFDDFFICLHAPEDNCECRKPKPGLLLQAKAKHPNIDFTQSWFIGDSDCDVEAGRNVGAHTYKIKKNENLNHVVSGILNGK